MAQFGGDFGWQIKAIEGRVSGINHRSVYGDAQPSSCAVLSLCRIEGMRAYRLFWLLDDQGKLKHWLEALADIDALRFEANEDR